MESATPAVRDTARAMSQENVEVVKAAFAHGSRGDFDGLLALVDPRVEWIEDPRLPGAIARRGHAEVKRYFACPGTGRSCGSTSSDLSTTAMRFSPSLG